MPCTLVLGCAGEHLNAAVSQNIGAAAPLTHPHQMAASSPPALYHQVETHHCHLLICSYTLKMLMCCMHEIFIYEGRRYDGYSFYLEL